jgi:hypothetical protein
MNDQLHRLAAVDPARDRPEPAPDLDLLERIVALRSPTQTPSNPRADAARRKPWAISLGAAVLLAAAVLVLANGGGRRDLAAVAYAQTAPAGAILHTVETTINQVRTVSGESHASQLRVERWLHGGESHSILQNRLSNGQVETYDQVLGADGVLRNRLPKGEVQQVRPGDGSEARDILGEADTDAITEFRRRYAAGQLKDAGTTTFHGRPAREYIRETQIDGSKVAGGQNVGLQTTRESFFLDASSGEPLGIRRTTENSTGSFTDETTIERFERLPVTPTNLAAVRG